MNFMEKQVLNWMSNKAKNGKKKELKFELEQIFEQYQNGGLSSIDLPQALERVQPLVDPQHLDELKETAKKFFNS